MKLPRLLIPMAASLLTHIVVLAAVFDGLRVEPVAKPLTMLQVSLHAEAETGGMGDASPPPARPATPFRSPALAAAPASPARTSPDAPVRPSPLAPVEPAPLVTASSSAVPAARSPLAEAGGSVAPPGDAGSGAKGPVGDAGRNGVGDKPAGEAGGGRSEPRFRIGTADNPAPAYPAVSRRLGEEGRVVLKVRVSEQGRADEVQVEQSSTFERLDLAAVQTVKRWRFVPARQGSVAVAGWARVPIRFRLDEEG